MNVDIPVLGPEQYIHHSPQNRATPLIESRDIKAILYLGIRGEISLPVEKHEVDILA